MLILIGVNNMRTSNWFQIALASFIAFHFSPEGFKFISIIIGLIASLMLLIKLMNKLERYNQKIADFAVSAFLCCITITGFVDNNYWYVFYGALGSVWYSASILWIRSEKYPVIEVTVNYPLDKIDCSKKPMSAEVKEVLAKEAEDMYNKAHKILV